MKTEFLILGAIVVLAIILWSRPQSQPTVSAKGKTPSSVTPVKKIAAANSTGIMTGTAVANSSTAGNATISAPASASAQVLVPAQSSPVQVPSVRAGSPAPPIIIVGTFEAPAIASVN